MNVNAGGDIVASTMHAVFYHLLKHPSTLAKLINELSSARSQHCLTFPLPVWSETQPLPKQEWRIRNAWIVRQEGVNVLLSRRVDGTKTAVQ